MHGTTEQTFDKRFIGFFHVCFARFERAIQPPILSTSTVRDDDFMIRAIR